MWETLRNKLLISQELFSFNMEIVYKPLGYKDLLAVVGEVSYHRAVTEEDFWREVGERLARKRKTDGTSVAALLEDGGPTNKTVQEIESGNVKQIGKLRDYARIVGIDLVDLFRSVLKTDEDEISEELQFVIRQFKDGGVIGRAAFVSTARLVEARLVSPSQASPDAQQHPQLEKSRAENGVAKRREKRR